jgi:hypothetical protein
MGASIHPAATLSHYSISGVPCTNEEITRCTHYDPADLVSGDLAADVAEALSGVAVGRRRSRRWRATLRRRVTRGHDSTEDAVIIERLPDLKGFLKVASRPGPRNPRLPMRRGASVPAKPRSPKVRSRLARISWQDWYTC